MLEAASIGRRFTSGTFAELQALVGEHEEGCFDESASIRGLAYDAGDRLRFTGSADDGLFAGAVSESVGQLTLHSLRQLTGRLDGPSMRWLGDERHTDESLRADVMNAVIRARDDAELLIRRKGELVRSILSSSYSVFNHSTFIELVGGALSQLGDLGGDVKVHKAQVGDELRAYVLLPRVVFGTDPGNAIAGGTDGDGGRSMNAAVYVSNSEIGTGKVRIHGGLFRLVCENGMIAWEREEGGLEFVHRGLSTRTMASAVADALVSALELSEAMADHFIASQAVLMQPGKIKGLASKWGEKYGLALSTVDDWYKLVGFEARMNGRDVGTVTLFDFVNAATYAAHDLEPAEAEQVERMAGDLIYSEAGAIGALRLPEGA